jgi:hypothetical protein
VRPSIALSSAAGSVSRCVGCVLGEVSEELGAYSSPPCRVSSGDLERVCASRRPLGCRGWCCRILGDRTERTDGSREEDPGGGDVGDREEDMVVEDSGQIAIENRYAFVYRGKVR